MLNKFKIKHGAISLSVALAVSIGAPIFTSSGQAIAGGSWTGGSSEVTQILNNVQLLWQSAQDAEDFIVQLDQYSSMMDNLTNLDASAVARQVGGIMGTSGGGSMANLIDKAKTTKTLYDKTVRFKESATNMAMTLESANTAGFKLNMTPVEFGVAAAQESANRSGYMSGIIKKAENEAKTLEEDSKALNEAAKSASSNSKGNLESLGKIQAATIVSGRIAADTKEAILDLKNMAAIQGAAAANKETYEIKRLEQQQDKTNKTFKLK